MIGQIEEHGKYTVKVIDERAGQILDEAGYLQQTHNCYAGIGLEIDENDAETGRVIAWGGNNGSGSVDVVADEDLDSYLADWDSQWIEQFEAEGLISA